MFGRLLTILALFPAGSCCGLFEFFGCGTGTPLVPVSWDSPRDTLRTFLAAARASDTKVIYESLSEEFKREHGLDGVAVAVIWQKLQDDVPYLHLVGTADIVAEYQVGSRRVYELDAYGHRFGIGLVRQPYWDLGRVDPAGSGVLEVGEYVEDLAGVLDTVDGETGRVSVRLHDASLLGIERNDISFVRIGFAWKIIELDRME